jgi:hypothetical protein
VSVSGGRPRASAAARVNEAMARYAVVPRRRGTGSNADALSYQALAITADLSDLSDPVSGPENWLAERPGSLRRGRACGRSSWLRGIEEVRRRIRDTHPGSVGTLSLRRQPALGRKALNVGDRAELPGTVILGGLQQQLRYRVIVVHHSVGYRCRADCTTVDRRNLHRAFGMQGDGVAVVADDRRRL